MAFEMVGDFPAPTPAPNPAEWLIDIGPFMDRFGSAKLAVLASPDENVQACIKDLLARKWIDLRRPDLPPVLDMIGAAVPAVTAELKATILTTPINPGENLAVRKLYFS